MKRIVQLSVFLALFLITAASLQSFAGDDGGRIKVYIVNKCSSDVEFKVASPGSSTHYTAYDNSKKPMTFVEGTKIYNSDGKMVHEVSSSSEGDEVVVCD